MTMPEQYNKITYIASDDGSFECNFSELMEEDGVTIKRTYQQITTDEEGLYKTETKYKQFTISEAILTDTRSAKINDEAKQIMIGGNYMTGEKILLTTAILYFDTADNINDVVVVDGVDYNIVGKMAFNKPIPYVAYMLKAKTKKTESEEI